MYEYHGEPLVTYGGVSNYSTEPIFTFEVEKLMMKYKKYLEWSYYLLVATMILVILYVINICVFSNWIAEVKLAKALPMSILSVGIGIGLLALNSIKK